jgi:3-phosphoshikimate 1-carboxyvinyltransferase
MNYTLTSPKRLLGTLRAPSDRSITVRAALIASIAEGVSRIREPLDSDDTNAALQCMADLGVQTAPLSSMCDPLGLRIPGLGLRGLRGANGSLFCNSSGTTMRLLAGFLAGQRFDSTLDGSEQLRKRPMKRVTEPLRAMGAEIEDTNGNAPLKIHAIRDTLHGITYDMPIASAQVKSALLLAGLYADGPITIHEPAPTRDHTERMLRVVGVDVQTTHHPQWVASDERRKTTITIHPSSALRPLDFLVPADFSSAAFFLVAAAIVPGAHLRLIEVGLNSTRLGLLDALQAMGAQIVTTNPRDEGGEPMGDLEVSFTELHATEVGGAMAASMMDEFPVFAVAATQAAGVTVVRDAQELRVKESNRLEGFVGELRKLGAKIEPTADGFVIEGPTKLKGAVVDGLGDHRVAMALAVAALVAEGDTALLGADCVAKTYPTFFRDLESLMS